MVILLVNQELSFFIYEKTSSYEFYMLHIYCILRTFIDCTWIEIMVSSNSFSVGCITLKPLSFTSKFALFAVTMASKNQELEKMRVVTLLCYKDETKNISFSME